MHTARFFATIILILLLFVSIAVATKWAAETSSSETNSEEMQQFASDIGNLALSAMCFAENKIVLDLTFSGTGACNHPRYVWTLWVSNSTIPNYRNLFEGLEVVEGTLMENVSSPVPSNSLSLGATLHAIADGEWVVYGLFSATAGSGFYHGLSSGGIRIIVSNGRIVKLEKELY